MSKTFNPYNEAIAIVFNLGFAAIASILVVGWTSDSAKGVGKIVKHIRQIPAE